MNEWIKDERNELVGKTILAVFDHEGRSRYGDDPGVRIVFTDDTSVEISAGMGQGCGYLIGI